MGTKDKYNDGYMTGKVSALEIVKKDGIEALEKDISMRRAYKVPCDMSTKEWESFIHTVGKGCKEMIFALIYITLHEDFGFGEARMDKFYDGFVKRHDAIFDVSLFGNRYVSLVDYAVTMKEKYPNLRLDIDRVASEEDGFIDRAERDTKFLESIITILHQNGFEDASQYLLKRKHTK